MSLSLINNHTIFTINGIINIINEYSNYKTKYYEVIKHLKNLHNEKFNLSCYKNHNYETFKIFMCQKSLLQKLRRRYIKCSCGIRILQGFMRHHRKSNKHTLLINNNKIKQQKAKIINNEKIAKHLMKYHCVCGSIVVNCRRKRHEQTIKHTKVNTSIL